jgi:acyl carrier protein
MDSVKTRLITVFKKVFKNETETSIPTLGEDTSKDWNSISVVKLVLAVENEFGLSFDDVDLEHFTSFKNILKFLKLQKD